ncbi:MAG: phosphate ABC transporter substrate-binding protein [Lentisphaeria bacterium]|nr:phosphate ABC transporter substrate-binding protein [Lentisphaeria bacterium]
MNMKKITTALVTGLMGAVTAFAGEAIVMDGSTTVGPIAKAFAQYYMSVNKDVNITVSESGSGNGAKSLLNKKCDIGNLSRFMKDSEFKACVDAGVFPVANVVALDGLPVLVHPGNPVSNLTVEQVRKIYLGEITNWKEVGGADMAIVKISRETNSGTYETFQGKVMTYKDAEGKKVEGKMTADTEYVGSNGAVRARVQSTPAAIGYAGIGFIDDTVKPLRINNIEPKLETVKNGSYPIARPLYMFTDGTPKMGSHLYNFINLYLTETGQELVEEIGFIPVTSY